MIDVFIGSLNRRAIDCFTPAAGVFLGFETVMLRREQKKSVICSEQKHSSRRSEQRVRRTGRLVWCVRSHAASASPLFVGTLTHEKRRQSGDGEPRLREVKEKLAGHTLTVWRPAMTEDDERSATFCSFKLIN